MKYLIHLLNQITGGSMPAGCSVYPEGGEYTLHSASNRWDYLTLNTMLPEVKDSPPFAIAHWRQVPSRRERPAVTSYEISSPQISPLLQPAHYSELNDKLSPAWIANRTYATNIQYAGYTWSRYSPPQVNIFQQVYVFYIKQKIAYVFKYELTLFVSKYPLHVSYRFVLKCYSLLATSARVTHWCGILKGSVSSDPRDATMYHEMQSISHTYHLRSSRALRQVTVPITHKAIHQSKTMCTLSGT